MGEENLQHDPYRYTDESENTVRRRLSLPQQRPSHYHNHPQYHVNPTNQHVQYPNEVYQQYENQEEGFRYPEDHQGNGHLENSEGYSLAELQWYTNNGEEIKEVQSPYSDLQEGVYKEDDVPHPYKREEVKGLDKNVGISDQSGSGSHSSYSSRHSSSHSSGQEVKVSDFPYEFHISE